MDIDKAINHLQKVDSRMKTLIKKYGHPKFSPIDNYFEALIKSIVSQQISTTAASAIYNRFKTLFNGDHFPNPKNVLAVKDEKLMSVGLSRQKIKYIKDLSNKWDQIEIKLSNIKLMTDQEIRDILLDVKGIGQWTVDMFLIFSLARPDVFPAGDLVIQKGYAKLYNMINLPNKNEMLKGAERWKPYRTLACLYLWDMIDGPFQW